MHAAGGLAAYLPGERIGTRDQVILRLAVDPDGHVATTTPGGPPTAGPQLEDFLMPILDRLRVLAIVDPETAIGPPGLPADQLRQDAEQPDADTRQVYAWQAKDTTVGRIVATSLDQNLDLHRDGDWVIAAPAHGSPLVLHQAPGRGRMSIHPFVIVERRAELRAFTYIGGAKDSDLRVHVESGPPLLPAPPPGAHPDTTALSQWLARPEENHEHAPGAPSGVATPSPAQVAVIERVISGDDPSSALEQLCQTFEVPELVARLAEVPHGQPDPVTPWQIVSPQSRRGIVAAAIADANSDEPTGRMPWHALDRAIYHRPTLGLALGFIEMVLAGILVAVVINGLLSPWWWILVGAIVLVAMDHTTSGAIRRHALRHEESSPDPTD